MGPLAGDEPKAAPDDTLWIRDARPVKYAAIGPIAIHFPERMETNEQLQAENPSWDMELIHSKTGIARRLHRGASRMLFRLGSYGRRQAVCMPRH